MSSGLLTNGVPVMHQRYREESAKHACQPTTKHQEKREPEPKGEQETKNRARGEGRRLFHRKDKEMRWTESPFFGFLVTQLRLLYLRRGGFEKKNCSFFITFLWQLRQTIVHSGTWTPGLAVHAASVLPRMSFPVSTSTKLPSVGARSSRNSAEDQEKV